IFLQVAQQLVENIGDELAEEMIDEFIDEIRVFVKDDLECVMEQVAPDGSVIDHIDGRTLNPGHAIEAAWFILHEAKRRGGDPE
ncbi:MAG: N-acylglucosamine 2-epimerase, partial [Akkermansiaceae bacterium]|nr:N-acylglucosamine 2-epimerase [Akkermansiaceae bacterium]